MSRCLTPCAASVIDAAPIRGTAHFSRCGRYRYRLTRRWDAGTELTFVMLNPSLADATIDDPTIRRCIGFARREGASGIVVVNLYAFRATRPDVLRRAENPFGPRNREALIEAARNAGSSGLPLICAWGAHGVGSEAVALIRRAGTRLACLGKTASGAPRHPLYVKADQPFEGFA
jgi:hypothetical protein